MFSNIHISEVTSHHRSIFRQYLLDSVEFEVVWEIEMVIYDVLTLANCLQLWRSMAVSHCHTGVTIFI